MYYLLSGKFPFEGKTNKDIMIAVKDKKNKVKFPGFEWEIITEEAKELIKKMLNKEVK